MGGENQNHQPTLLQSSHSFSNSSSSAPNGSNVSSSPSFAYNSTGLTNEQLVNNMMRHVDDTNINPQQFRNSIPQQQQQQQQQQNGHHLDINNLLGINGNNSVVPSHLGHNGGHHLVSHLMGAQYNFNQPPQPPPAYSGPTHSVLPSIPSMPVHTNNNNMSNINNMNGARQQPYQNNGPYNAPPPMNNMPNGMLNPPMNNANGPPTAGTNGDAEMDNYSQDVLLLVVEQQRRIYHLEEELQKANEYIGKLQDYAKGLEVEKEKHAKKQSRYWTQQEHQKFLQGIEKYGRKDVKAISNYVGTRNPTQVRTHAQKYYAKIEREQRRALGTDGKRNSLGASNSSADDSDDDVISDEQCGSDGSGSGSGSGSSGSTSGPPMNSQEYANFTFPSTEKIHEKSLADGSIVPPEANAQVQQTV